MNSPQPYRREIDACRPGSDDLQLPELAGLAGAVGGDARVTKALAASHASDLVLCDALQEVPIPSGLADRLLDQLLTPRRETAVVETDRSQPKVAPATAKTVDRPVSRRALWAAAAALAASLLVALGITFWNPSKPRTITQGQLASLADAWYQQAVSPQGWERFDPATRERFPIDHAVVGTPRWQRTMLIEGDAEGVAYDLTRSGKQRAILFVVRTKDRYGVQALAFTPLAVTGRKTVGAWQKGEYLYVLAVVEADGQRIGDFIEQHDLT